MLTLLPTTGPALPPVPLGRRRRPCLHELVRDLAGWTRPAHPTTTSRPPANWRPAWTAQ